MRILASLLLSLAALSAQAEVSFTRTALQIGMYRIDAEVADTDAERQQGLMFRKSMAPNAGMLFVFPIASQHCFWMKNTDLPLSIAFIDSDGRIINIEDMKPQTETSHCALKPAQYALEMNKGWFKDKGLKAGSKVSGLPR
ncbi:DUF192 domain-containing protein [Viridibacterium curvum]|uniref:DUF192 domain-containing protein n=1 Tax=Viridibacterium curvum TaxID=1101404 RepID=A0ABP9QZ59_9RHOO